MPSRRTKLGFAKVIVVIAVGVVLGQVAFTQSSARSPVTASVRASEANVSAPSCTSPDGLMTKAQGVAILEELARIEAMLAAKNSIDSAPGAVPPAATGPARLKMAPDWHVLGRGDAPVVVVEFTDLQCPVCQRFHSTTFARIKSEYIDTGKIRFVSRDLPLAMHAYAHDAAIAELCAGVQGKFWDFRDAVLAANEKPAPEELALLGQKLGLDMNAFAQCQRQNSFSNSIENDADDAQAAGIRGTPSFVIGRAEKGWIEGVKLLGNRPYPAFQTAIEAALQGSTNVPSQATSTKAREESKR